MERTNKKNNPVCGKSHATKHHRTPRNRKEQSKEIVKHIRPCRHWALAGAIPEKITSDKNVCLRSCQMLAYIISDLLAWTVRPHSVSDAHIRHLRQGRKNGEEKRRENNERKTRNLYWQKLGTTSKTSTVNYQVIHLLIAPNRFRHIRESEGRAYFPGATFTDLTIRNRYEKKRQNESIFQFISATQLDAYLIWQHSDMLSKFQMKSAFLTLKYFHPLSNGPKTCSRLQKRKPYFHKRKTLRWRTPIRS